MWIRLSDDKILVTVSLGEQIVTFRKLGNLARQGCVALRLPHEVAVTNPSKKLRSHAAVSHSPRKISGGPFIQTSSELRSERSGPDGMAKCEGHVAIDTAKTYLKL